MPTYTLTWRDREVIHRVVGTGPSILALYDLLAPIVESDFLVIYAKYAQRIAREELVQRIA